MGRGESAGGMDSPRGEACLVWRGVEVVDVRGVAKEEDDGRKMTRVLGGELVGGLCDGNIWSGDGFVASFLLFS